MATMPRRKSGSSSSSSSNDEQRQRTTSTGMIVRPGDDNQYQTQEPDQSPEPSSPEPAPLQQTSTQRRRETERRAEKLDTMLSREEALQQSTQEAQEAAELIGGSFKRGEGFIPGDDEEETEDDLAEEQEAEQQEEDAFSGLDQEAQSIRQEAKQEIDKVNEELARFKQRMDSASGALIDSVRRLYKGRIEEMEQKNERLLETTRTGGVRAGRSRYTPELEAGILDEQERENIARIAKLEGEMMKAVAEAQQSRAQNNLDIFNQRMDRVEQIEQDMQDEIQNLYDNAQAIEEERRLQRKEERQQQKQEFDQMLDMSERAAPSVAEAISQFDDPDKQMEFINKYAEKTGIDGQILYGDVSEALDEDEQNALDRANTRSQMQRRKQQMAQDAREESDEMQRDQLQEQIAQRLSELDQAGGVTEDAWNTAKRTWVANGYSAEEFENLFSDSFFEEL